MANTKDGAAETEEQKFKVKCQELRKRIAEVEESNEISTLALLRTRMSIRRLRLEYAVLLERLEGQVVRFLEENGSLEAEAMSRPNAPLLVDENLDFKVAKPKGAKQKKGRNGTMSAAALRKAARDPNLPKRPTNAYLMFCDREKDRVRAELEKENPGKPVTELTRVLTDMWKALDDPAKVPYLKLYEEDRERYQREMAVYNKRKNGELNDKSIGDKGKPGLPNLDSDAVEEPDTPGETGETGENEDNEENVEEQIQEKDESLETDLTAVAGLKREASDANLPVTDNGDDLGKRQKL